MRTGLRRRGASARAVDSRSLTIADGQLTIAGGQLDATLLPASQTRVIGGRRPLPPAGAGGETDSPSYDAVSTASLPERANSAEPRPTGDGRTGAMVTSSTGDGGVDNGGAAEGSAAAARATIVSTAAAAAAWPSFTPPPAPITARGTGGTGSSVAT